MGRLVTEKLISKGFFVKIFDLPSANYEGFDPNKTEIIRGDLNDKSDLEFAINNVHSIIHLAAILPPLANQFIYIVKMSAFASVIGMQELTRRANEIVVTEYRPLEVYTLLIFEYLVLVLAISFAVRWLERKMGSNESLNS